MRNFAFVAFLFVVGANATPQFGLPKIPVVPPPASLPVPAPIPDTKEILEWPAKIQDLVDLTQNTLTGMGDIAVADNPEVGAVVVAKLQEEIAKATKILADYTAKTVATGRLRKRETSNGAEAYNSVGEVLVKSNDKIEPEKKKLSPEARKKINKKHFEGVEKCGADSCKAAAKTLKAADDAEDERQ